MSFSQRTKRQCRDLVERLNSTSKADQNYLDSHFKNKTKSVFLCKDIVCVPTSTMDSYTKDTHKYAFELVKAARTMRSI